MVNEKIVKLIQDTADSFINSNGANYNSKYNGYTCTIYNEFTYQFKEDNNNTIEAIIKFGSATKNNDLEDKYSMQFVINIFSEQNGWTIAKDLFDDIFKVLTRTYQTLGTYQSKIFLSSPVLMNETVEIGSNFYAYSTMNGSVEFSENVVLGATYQLSIDGVNWVNVKPRQPYELRECIGSLDTALSDTDDSAFTYSSNNRLFNMILLYEQKATTGLSGSALANANNFNTLFNDLLDDCENPSDRSYDLKVVVGTKTYTHDLLIMVRGQHIYDETTGENVLSMQFKKRA